MSFFSRKKQPSSSSNPNPHPNIVVAQTPSQALAQTRESSRTLSTHQSTGSSSNIRAQSPPGQMAPPSLTTRMTSPSEPPPSQPLANQQHRQPNYPWSMRQLSMLPLSPLPRSPPSSTMSSPPFPRYGHSVPAIGNQNGELFLFGGLVRDEVRNDLYCISSRDQSACLWQVQGDIPSPRVGHASALVSNVLIIWGGDTKADNRVSEGENLDDGLYLLNLVTREWTRIDPEGVKPLGRYGHAVAMIGTKFYVFGGQVDGEFLNDVWSFDLNSLVKSEPRWERVTSFNDAPHARTGHACAASGEMLYVFGGTDGQYHYNDTWCFDPRVQRWTELQCIGFIPAPREGHSVAVVDDVIYIFGGRGVDGKDLGDLTGFRISNKRWYMFQNMGPAPSGRSGHAMASVGSRVYVLGGESYTSARPDDPTTFHVLDTKHIKYPDASSSRSGNQSRKPSAGSNIPPSQGSTHVPPSQGGASTTPPPHEVDTTKITGSPAHPGTASTSNEQLNGQNDESYARGTFNNEVQRAQEPNPGRTTPLETQDRPRTPDAYNRPTAQASSLPVNAETSHIAPSDSRELNNQVDSMKHAPLSMDTTLMSGAPGSHGLANSSNNITQESMRSLRQELSTLRKKEGWMKAALSKAVQEGLLLPPDGSDSVDLPSTEVHGSNSGLLSLRQSHARMQAEVTERVQQLSDVLNRYEHVRSGALQEAAFYRAKLAAYESGSAVDIGRLEGDRAAQLESKLAALSADYSAQEARLEESRRDGFVQIRLREQAEIRALEACQRLEELEESNRHIANEYVDLQANYEASQSTVRNQAQRLFSQNSILEQKEADFLYAKTRLEALDAIQQQHSQFVEQTQTTLDVSSTRLSDITTQWEIATQKIGELEADLAEAKAELDARTAETSAATSRLAEVENAWAQSREEADALRSLTTQRLGELLDSHRDLKIDEDHLIDSHNEKVRALEVELSSLRSLQAEISEHSGQLQSVLSHSRRQKQDADTERSQLKKQILGLRAQLSDALSESGKLHNELSDSKCIIDQHTTIVSKIESKYAMLRRYVEDNGVSVEGFTSEVTSSVPRELQAPSSQTTSPQQDFEVLRGQYQDALRQISTLNSEVDRIRSNHESDSPRQQEQVDELRQALAESESAHQDRMRQLENDYQTAVHYVKGSEKMLHRMKEELAKQKVANSALQTELESFRGSETGSRSRVTNGRGTPMSEDSHDPSLRSQLHETQRQNQRLITENQDLRRRFDSLDHDLELMRDSLISSQQEAESKTVEIERLEIEIERLEEVLSLARQANDASFVERLASENTLLQRKNAEFAKKIELLLEVEQANFERDRPISGLSHDGSDQFETFSNELDDWHRKLANSSLHSRVVEESIPHESQSVSRY